MYRVQAYDSIMCRYWIYWFNVKRLLESTNLFSPNDYEKNEKIILKRWKNYIVWFVVNIENSKNLR